MKKHFECSAHTLLCAGMLIAVSVSIFLRLCSVSVGWCLSVGLPLSLFVPSVFVTMPALSLCREPNGWLVKGTEMLDWVVSDALHLYSAQGAKPPRRRRARGLSLREPLPSLIFLCTSLPQWTFLFTGVTISAAQSLPLDDETDNMCSTYKPVSCLGLVYFWLWNVALGNRELHWKHLVPALFQAERGVSCGQRNVKYIVGVWPVQRCLWSNSQLSFLGNGTCSWKHVNIKLPKCCCFKPKRLVLQ